MDEWMNGLVVNRQKKYFCLQRWYMKCYEQEQYNITMAYFVWHIQLNAVV